MGTHGEGEGDEAQEQLGAHSVPERGQLTSEGDAERVNGPPE